MTQGNGRTQQQFFNDLAKGAGFTIDWASIPKAVNDRASQMARGGEELLMKAMFDVIVSQTPERARRQTPPGISSQLMPYCPSAITTTATFSPELWEPSAAQ